MYLYEAKVVKIVDGDTIDLDVILGFYMTARIRFRLKGIDTPEIRGPERPEGLEAKQFVEDFLGPIGSICTVQSYKTGKYGRWIGEIWNYNNENLGDALIDNNHAERYYD